MKTKLLALALAILSFSVLHTLAQQPGTLLWSYNAGNLITTCPAIAPDGTIYIGTGDGLYAITNAGSNKWTFAAHPTASPAIGSDGTIYFADNSTGAKFYAVNPDGSQKWMYSLQEAYPYALDCNSSPAIGMDGSVYVEAGGRLYALTAAGAKKWDVVIDDDTSTRGPFSPIIGPDGTIYIGSGFARTFYAINPNGTVKWQFPLQNAAGESAALGANGTIYITGGGYLYALSPDGSTLWVNTTNSFSSSCPVIGRDGTIHMTGEVNRSIYAISPAGGLLWRAIDGTSWHNPPPSTPAVDAGGMIYYTYSNTLFAVTSQGNIQWTFDDPYDPYYALFDAQFSPCIGPDGTIYASFGPTLHAIKGTNALGNTPWPMYRQNLRHTGKVEHPSLQKITKRPDSNFEFQLLGEVGQTYQIERSTNLSLWTTLTNLIATNPPLTITDLSASNFPAAFYRALQQ